MSAQCSDLRTRAGIPKFDHSLLVRRRQGAPVRRKGNRFDRTGLSAEGT